MNYEKNWKKLIEWARENNHSAYIKMIEFEIQNGE